jgi:hypothetical protein
VTRLITREDVVLRLQGFGLCDLKPDRCVASDQIDSYLEPDGRSGITFPSVLILETFGTFKEILF